MTATLLAIFTRPEGGEDALDELMTRYLDEHMPLIEMVPGLRSSVVEKVAQHYAGEDLVIVTRMEFDDSEALQVGMASDEMKVAGRNLRDIAPGLLTLVALDEDPVS
ncbi:MAG: EthD family reductase [Chloroflexota bacterium]|nr:EthD family reductase [Chloroflexota bacterium]